MPATSQSVGQIFQLQSIGTWPRVKLPELTSNSTPQRTMYTRRANTRIRNDHLERNLGVESSTAAKKTGIRLPRIAANWADVCISGGMKVPQGADASNVGSDMSVL